MKTKNLIITVFYIASLLVIPASTLFAQGHNGKCMAKNLPGITEEQTKKFDALKISHLKEMMPIKNQLAEKKAQLNTLTSAEKADMGAINIKIDEIGTLKTDMMKKKEAHRQEIRKILTEEQRLMFDMHKGQMGKGHCKGMGEGKGKMHGKTQKCSGEGPHGK